MFQVMCFYETSDITNTNMRLIFSTRELKREYKYDFLKTFPQNIMIMLLLLACWIQKGLAI